MIEKRADLGGIKLRIIETDALVIGSGCAGFNAADWLYDLGVEDVVLITEGVNKGTSRNTGSDKQTYYKLSIAAGEADSIDEMTDTLFGAGVNGDTALTESACSLQSFFKLVNLGVPFPINEYGEFVGYKTDHDPRQRATSAGPLTSKLMTEALEHSVLKKGIAVIDGMQAVKLFTDSGKLLGVLAIDLTKIASPDEAFVYFRCDNAILATGGPASLYRASVYPESQTGMTGMAIDTGAELCNFSEWQYGLASVGFRWNVSGTYQQALPRYIAIDRDGNEREFLNDYYDDPFRAVDIVFLKGYQWPFDTLKIGGSSQIDLIVHHETAVLGNRVFMDFTRNPSCIDRKGFSELDSVTREYLENSGALFGTPIERLRVMNSPAIELFMNNGIDISKQPLEVAVCAQHCNGGLAVDADWQTSVVGLYAAGESAGTFGVHRPGGSALNSAQVGAMRAARHIASKTGRTSADAGLPEAELRAFIREVTAACEDAADIRNSADGICEDAPGANGNIIYHDEYSRGGDYRKQMAYIQTEMSRAAAFIRDEGAIAALEPIIKKELDAVFSQGCAFSDLPELLKYRDMLLTVLALLSAIKVASEAYGSCGSSLALKKDGAEPSPALASYRYAPAKEQETNTALYTQMTPVGFRSWTAPVRPIPDRDTWFETVWSAFRR